MLSFEEFASLPASEKVVLCTIEATQGVKIFSLAGSVYSKVVSHFVTSVKESVVPLIKASSPVLNPGEWFFEPKTMTLYVRTYLDANPKTTTLTLTYRIFMANLPQILPWDFASGDYVEWDARISSIGSLGQQLDDENTGVVTESSSSISLVNTDGFFDEVFDTLIFENQKVKFYSWSPRIPLSQARPLFEGIIESKSYSSDLATFKIKDYIYLLKNTVKLDVFSAADGNVLDSMIGKPKRRIYGRADSVKCTSLDCVLKGMPITGVISGTIDLDAVIGTGTLFLTELSPGDQLTFTQDDVEIKLSVDTIQSNTQLTLGSKSEVTFLNIAPTLKPDIPPKRKNRFWQIAGHKLHQPSTTVTSVLSANRIRVANAAGFFVGDQVTVGTTLITVRRVSGNVIVLSQSITPYPSIGTAVVKSPVSAVYLDDKKLFITRDWILHNNPTGAVIEFNQLAEFNIAPQKQITVNLSFVSGTRDVTTTAVVDLRTLVKPNDWIRKNKATESTWYEVLMVSEQKITLRTNFVGVTEVFSAYVRPVEMISDESLVTVDCIGAENAEGAWIETPSDAVRHLVLNDAGFEQVNEASFLTARSDCPYIISMVIPEDLGDDAPDVKSVVTQINESVFGSVYGHDSVLSFSILNAEKPATMSPIKDDDIVSWTIETDQQIVNEVKVNYRPFVDKISGMSAFRTKKFQSDFVDRMMGIKNTMERTIYLYEDDKAEIIAQRFAFYNSLSNCKIRLSGKLSLATLNVNDKIFLSLDRLFKRYGSLDRMKIGIVSGYKNNGSDVELEVIDLGNTFNRVPSIAANDASPYSAGIREEIVRNGYILDNDTLTPDNTSEDSLGNNLIG